MFFRRSGDSFFVNFGGLAMLIRRHFEDRESFIKNRQGNALYHFNEQEVILDRWENDDCTKAIAKAFSADYINFYSWTRVSCGQPLWGQHFVRVLEDWFTQYIYYRRPIDIERQMKYNSDENFRISANEWWDTKELNEWWKRLHGNK